MGLLQTLLVSVLFTFHHVTPQCSDNQQEKCMEMYYRSTSFWFPTNELKECRTKSYAEFSHICTVQDYLPNVEHCCCSMPRIPVTNNKHQQDSDDNVVLCCRYHQDWNIFRCLLEQDVIDPNTYHSGKYTIFETYPYNIFFYMLFVVLSIIFIVIIIHLIKKALRNRKRVYKQASQENRLLRHSSSNIQSAPTIPGLPPYTEKPDGLLEGRIGEPSHPTAPTDELVDEVFVAGISHNENFSNFPASLATTLDNLQRNQTPPPPYE